MDIKKRTGQLEPYDGRKIIAAVEKAFLSVGPAPEPQVLQRMLKAVERMLEGQPVCTVEEVQDRVEQVLMEQGHYQAAKSYILYRQKRTELRAARAAIVLMLIAASRP